MSPLFKLFLGLVAIFCFAQVVEMARLRRDEASTSDIGDTLAKLIEQLKSKIDTDEVKNFIKSAADNLTEGTKKLSAELSKMSATLGGNAAPAT